MRQGPQDVLGNHGTNTIFTVWNFKEGAPIKEAFQRICALVINLNHSAYVRFPDDNASCIMGIGYNAWHLLDLPKPLPKVSCPKIALHKKVLKNEQTTNYFRIKKA